jgi:hypothetical protein
VVKGKLDTPVHGVALGIPLQNASTGPFAQFQNSDDSEDALTQLVMQLVRRIPNSEPDREVVKTQVVAFREKSLPMVANDEASPATSAETDTTSVAKIFEEVKVMFQDLPGRIERRLDPDFAPNVKRRRRYPPHMMYEMLHMMERDVPDGIALIIVASQFRDEFPWIYDLAFDAYRRLAAKEPGALETLSGLEKIFHMTLRHPMFREPAFRNRDRRPEMDEMMSLMHETIDRLRDRSASRAIKAADIIPQFVGTDTGAPRPADADVS